MTPKHDIIEDWLTDISHDKRADSVISDDTTTPPGHKRKFSEMDAVPDLTPRPRRTAKRTADDMSDAASSSQYTQSESVVSSRKSRSISPVKYSTRLSTMVQPIVNGDFDDDTIADLDEGTQELVNAIESFADGIRIISDSVRGVLLGMRAREPALQRPDTFHADHSPEAQLGSPLPPSTACSIVQTSRSKSRLDSTESAWNLAVHYRVLETALELAPPHISSAIALQDITAARLLPHYQIYDPGALVRHSKAVDFGLVLHPSQAVRQSFTRLTPHEDGVRYWNHSNHTTLASMPLAISIETKRQGEGFTEGRNQLKVWAAAHLARLEELVAVGPCPNQPLLALPVILIQGPQWHFLLARQTVDERQGERFKSTVLHSGIQMGDTTSIAGVYRIVRCLLQLLRWISETYRPWFEANCLPCR